MHTNYHGYDLIEEREYQLDAELYNRVLLTLKRCHAPLSIKLPRVVYTRLELDKDIWWCLDHSLNDRPLFAWTGFDAERTALNEPVACRLLIFSPRAEAVLFEVQRELPLEMALRMRREVGSCAEVVTPFPKR